MFPEHPYWLFVHVDTHAFSWHVPLVCPVGITHFSAGSAQWLCCVQGLSIIWRFLFSLWVYGPVVYSPAITSWLVSHADFIWGFVWQVSWLDIPGAVNVACTCAVWLGCIAFVVFVAKKGFAAQFLAFVDVVSQ